MNKKEGVSNKYPGGIPQISGVVSHRYSNNTSIKKTNLNNVNTAGRGGFVENSRDKIREEKVESKEDINDIRKKIRQSLNKDEKGNFPELKNKEKEEALHKKGSDSERDYFKNNEKIECSEFKRRPEEKELLVKEIAEELEDDHSLGAFRTIVNKIPEQQIRIFLSIIKDTHLAGKIKSNKGAMFISIAKAYDGKNDISLNF